MAARPCEDAVLERHRPEHQIYQPQAPVSVIALMCPQPVVAAGDGHAIGIQEHDEQDPGSDRKSYGSARTTDEHQCGHQGDGEHQGGRPDAGAASWPVKAVIRRNSYSTWGTCGYGTAAGNVSTSRTDL